MPPLYIFGWRCCIGSDDLVLPSVFAMGMELLWLTIVITTYALRGCWGWNIVFFANVVLGILLFVCFLILTWLCMRGTIMDTAPRRNVLYVLIACIAIYVIRISFDVYGTYQAFGSAFECDRWKRITTRALVLFRWFITFIMMIISVMILDVLGYRTSRGKSLIPASIRVWETRCRILCCCCTRGINERVFKTIAQVLTSLFGNVDLVLSDVLVGLIMVHDEDKKVSSKESVSVTSESGISRQSWMTPETALDYINYALGCYSWPLYMWEHLATGVCQLYPYFRCCSCCSSSTSYEIVGDNCCKCDTAALKKMTGLTDSDLQYVSFHDKLYEVPFYVANDHKLSSIIVAIRGTLSFQDALTDLCANSSPIDCPELPSTFLAHKGIVETAKFVKKKLEEEDILLKATASNPNYSIVITGHSLGAGTAAVLATLIRSTYPHLRCFCFSPPKVLMSEDFARYADDFVMSIVIGYDLVARASYVTLNELKERIVDSLISCKKPKYKYVLNRCFQCFYKIDVHRDSRLPDEAEIPIFLETTSSESFPKMFLPGQILHIYYRDAEKSSITSQWTSREAFRKLVVNMDMLKDHMPDTVKSMLKQLVSQDTIT